MGELFLQPTSLAQWYSVVNEAQCRAPVALNMAIESYLVTLLMRYSTQPHEIQGIFALDFLNSAHLAGEARQEHLRAVGDKCLILAGLFPGRAMRRCLRISYFVDLGQTAYDSIPSSIFNNENSLYSQLARAFVPMMDVLFSIRALADQHPSLVDLHQAEEIWQQTGSRYAYQLLQKYHFIHCD